MHDKVVDAWTKCSAEVDWHGPTCFSDVITVYSGCLTSSGLFGEGSIDRGGFGREVVNGHGGVMSWVLPKMVQSGLVVHMFASKQRQQ